MFLKTQISTNKNTGFSVLSTNFVLKRTELRFYDAEPWFQLQLYLCNICESKKTGFLSYLITIKVYIYSLVAFTAVPHLYLIYEWFSNYYILGLCFCKRNQWSWSDKCCDIQWTVYVIPQSGNGPSQSCRGRRCIGEFCWRCVSEIICAITISAMCHLINPTDCSVITVYWISNSK